MTVTAYLASHNPADCSHLFVVGAAGEHIILPLQEKGDLTTVQLGGFGADVQAAAASPHPVEDLEAYMADFQTRVVDPALNPPAPAPVTPAEKLAAAGLSVDELRGLLGLQQEAS